MLRFSLWNFHQYEISPRYLTQLRCCTHVTHALCVASSARSFSIVSWTLFRPWPLYRPWTPWSMHLKKLVNIYLNGLVKTIPKIYMCLGIVSYTNFTNFHQLSPIFWPIFWKYSENVNGLDKTIPNIYVCRGIVGNTNFTNFHKFSPIFTNFDGILSLGLTRRFRKYIYVGVKSWFHWFQFCPVELGKNGGGGGSPRWLIGQTLNMK